MQTRLFSLFTVEFVSIIDAISLKLIKSVIIMLHVFRLTDINSHQLAGSL